MAKAKSERETMSYEWDESETVLILSDNDRVVRRFDFDEIPEALDSDFLKLGRKTKVANFAASAKSKGLNRLDMMDAGWNLLKSGEWEKEREAGMPTVRAEVEALARIKNQPVAAIQKALQDYDKETREKILANPKVVEMAKTIREEREAASVDLDDMV